MPEGYKRFRLETLNQIYDIRVAELGVPEVDQTENFPEGQEAGVSAKATCTTKSVLLANLTTIVSLMS
jgi:hypothetical protein